MSASQCSSLLLPTSADVLRSAGDAIAFDRPQGWLGIMLGNHLYYDLHGAVLSNEHRFADNLLRLTKEVEQYTPSRMLPQTQPPINRDGGDDGGGMNVGSSKVVDAAPVVGVAVGQNEQRVVLDVEAQYDKYRRALKKELAWLESNARNTNGFDRETAMKLKAYIVEQWCQSNTSIRLQGLHVDGILSTVQLELLTQQQQLLLTQNGGVDAGGGDQVIGMFGACVAAIAGIALGVCFALNAPTRLK